MTVTQEWPPDVDALVQAFLRPAAGLMAAEQWALAFESFTNAMSVLNQSQPVGIRFHKGFPLHNMGVCKFWRGQAELSRTNFLTAFIEDVLSYPGDDWMALPAARNLTGLFAISAPDLSQLAARIRNMNAAGADVANPVVVFAQLGLATRFPGEQTPQVAPAKKKPGRFLTDWKHRIFIGGSYSGQVAELNYIAAICRNAGHDPVIEFEFEVPPDLVHHHGLMLLHECRLAIFEVSTEAGQLMELERARDYGINPLVLYQGMPSHGRVSAMVGTLLGRLNLTPQRYGTMPELEALIVAYLSSHAPGP